MHQLLFKESDLLTLFVNFLASLCRFDLFKQLLQLNYDLANFAVVLFLVLGSLLVYLR